MMKKIIPALLIAAVASSVLYGTARAYEFTLTNKDEVVHKLELIENNDKSNTHDLELSEGDTVFDLCQEGCLVRFNGQEFNFSGSEEIVIEDGELINIAPQ